MQQSAPNITALQGAAVLGISRLFVFFCTETPFTAAYALGIAAYAGVQAVLVIILLLLPERIAGSRFLLGICRIYAVFRAVQLTGLLFSLLMQTQAPHPFLLMAAAVPVLAYTVSRPFPATARTATVLLFAAGLAFLLLPLAGLRSAHAVSLYMPGDFGAAFRREWLLSGEIWLFPLLVQKQPKRTAAYTAAGWLSIAGILIPLTVLLGTMQNGRLQHAAGNPFFLLLARTPLSDAVRVDGFWMVLAVCCGLTAISAGAGYARNES